MVVLLLLAWAALDLGLQEVYHLYLRPTPQPTSRPTSTPTQTPRPTALPTPAPSALPTAEVTVTATPPPLTFEDQRLQEALRDLHFRQQLLKVSLELLRAEDYLDADEMKQVERELIAVSAALDRARGLADESLRDTMADLQRDLSLLREDLYLRPERLREGIRRLWQRVDVLIGE